MDSLTLLFAFLADIFAGDPHGLPHPVRAIGRLITFFENLLVQLISNKKIAGVCLTLCVVLLTYFAAASLLALSAIIHPLCRFILSITFIYYCLSVKEMGKESRRVYDTLQNGDIRGARNFLSGIVGRDTKDLNESDIIRATVETVAESIVDGIISPLLYAMIGGAPLALAYKAVNTLDSMVGYRNEKYIDLGWASARLDDFANFIPARISGIIIPVTAFVLQKNWANALFTVLTDAKNHPSPNSGYPEAGMAGALGIRLGGTNEYQGVSHVRPFIGTNRRTLSLYDIKEANTIMYVTSLIVLFFLSILSL